MLNMFGIIAFLMDTKLHASSLTPHNCGQLCTASPQMETNVKTHLHVV